MLVFYLKSHNKNTTKDIHPYVFKSFLCMQFCNIIATTFDFIVYRIPCTSFVTSYLSTMKSDSIIRCFVVCHYGFDYISQFYTVLFCFIRVLVLYNPRSHLEVCRILFVVWSLVSVLLSICGSFPHIWYDAVGMQLDSPFQYGAIILTTTFAYGNRPQNIGGYFFSLIVTVSIAAITLIMLIKMKNLKLIDQHSKLKAKAETTLKITMCIIIIPSILSQTFALASFWAYNYACYIILVRPVFLDCRVNIVSCYFYWTHPYFKQKVTPKPVSVRSLSTS
ncbi:hypothetical protein CRE_09289 [Caenorhabditis remanei]|uniref:Serpentine receptor class gamma n=1 Tax=Caenorhabditis remanei TaxID=31234 RepID=E3LI05_CAERE|nr:hypothetical protein CRE_09289 [Caenorhabditis remanei]